MVYIQNHKTRFGIGILALLLVVCSLSVCLHVVPAMSANLGDAGNLLQESGNDTGIGSASRLGSLPVVIAIILQFILSLLGTLMFGYMVYAGFLWMTAQGDDSKISTAKGIMVNTVIGFLVVVSAWAITYLVQSRFQ